MIWQIFLGIFVACIVWKLLRKGEDNPLDALPGPPKWPFVGSIFSILGKSYIDMFSLILQFSKTYGQRFVVKVMDRDILHLSNVKDIEIVLSHSRNITKNKPYTFLQRWLGTGLLISTGSKWHRRRKILTPAFHFNILKNFSKVFEEKSRNLVHRLKQTPEKNVDVLAVISDFTLYTICETAMGTQLDCDKSAATVKYLGSIKEIGIQFINRLSKIWLHSDYLYYRSALGKQFLKCVNVVHSFANNVIMERKEKILNRENGLRIESASTFIEEKSKKRQALLDLLIEAEINGEIDLDGIREEVTTFMFEGHDTTAMALTFGLMLLADHEEVQERIYQECEGIFGGSDRSPSWSDLAEMKYLEATVKEMLRLYPSVPVIGREVTEDFMLGDLLVKKGAEVLVHIYVLHHQEDIYPDPEAFKPERFLNGEVRHPYAFIPFSAGPRNCIGQRFAMQEMKCVLSEICRNFTLAPKEKGARPRLTADMVLRPIDPVYVQFIPRQHNK